MKTSSKVLIAIPNLTAFYAIENDIIDLKKKATVDIVIIEVFSDQIKNKVESVVNQKGHKTRTLEAVSKDSYKILLEPYPLTSGINAEFRIRYEYGVTPSYAKPDPVYSPDWNLKFDAVICYSHIAANILSAVTKPCIVKPTQFVDFKLHKKTAKPNLLILFTWGDVTATDRLINIKKQLNNKYNIIIKAHHGVEYLPEHKEALKTLEEVADEYHDASANVNDLLKQADIVLTDNSSVVFTAIYLGIPAAIFTNANSDYFNLNGIKSAHFSLLIEPKRIAYTNEVKEIKSIIEYAMNNIDQQNKLKNEFYPIDVIDTLTSIVTRYMSWNRKKEPYYILRDILLNMKKEAEHTISNQDRSINDLKHKNINLELENEEIKLLNLELNNKLDSFLGIKRSARLFIGNIKRKILKILKVYK